MKLARNNQRAPGMLVEQLEYLLSAIRLRTPFDAAAVYARRDGRVEPLIALAADGARHSHAAVPQALEVDLQRLEPDSQPYALALSEEAYRSALVYPLVASGRALGALMLLSCGSQVYTDEYIGQVGAPAGVIAALLEHACLASELATAESIILTAQAIARDSSPHEVVKALCDHLFDESISSCAILFYGPIREDRPDGPFDYMEIKGSWTRRHGSQVAEGVRLYLDTVPDPPPHVRDRRCLVFHSMDELNELIDPFMRALLQLEAVQSVAAIRLYADQRPLGVLVVTSDQPGYFTDTQLRSYQAVGEFLALSVSARILEQHHNFVQQGRAALLDAVTDGVIMALPEGDGARVLTANQQFTAMFHLEGVQVQGMLLDELLDRMKIARRVQHDLRRVWSSVPMLDPAFQEGEFEMVGAKVAPSYIRWYSAPVYLQQRVMGRIYTFYDVTATRIAERLRTELLMRLSHELRTPLTSISGFAELILHGGGEALPDMAREYVEIIYQNAKRLNRVFNDLILINRANLGQLELRLRPVHLPDVIIEALANLEPQYKARGQTVLMQLDDDLPPVQVDADRIVQVVNNLVGNAIKYAPPGSSIRIATRHAAAADALPDSAPPDVITPCALVTIEDEGEGIARDEVEKVFLPFYRAAQARSQKIEGTGLGLAFSRSVIELHGGRLWAVARGRRRRGGLFLFTLPTVSQLRETSTT